MSKYGIEQFCDDLTEFMRQNLNTKIQELNAEAAVDDPVTPLVLVEIPDEAYAFMTMNDETMNFDPYIYIGIEDVKSQGTGPTALKTYTLVIAISLVDTNDLRIGKRILRYSRALEELFEENWDQIGDGIKLKISSLVPIQYKTINSTNEFRAVGINLELDMM